MNPEQSRLRQLQRTGLNTHHQVAASQEVKSFGSVEDLLRHDASQVRAPASLDERLKASLAAGHPPVRNWWKRWFGGR
jgi:hypothetical protein